MIERIRFSLFLLCFIAAPVAADRLSRAPFFISNYNPIPQISGLPGIPDLTPLLSASEKKLSWGIYSNYGNYFAATVNHREMAIVDGEFYRYMAQLSYRLSSKWVLQGIFPYNHLHGGSMDAGIESWHKIFNLPDGGRRDFPRDQFHFYYQRDGQVLVDYSRETRGAGDISLRMLYSLNNSGRNNVGRNTAKALFAQVELPTGDDKRWQGNGQADYSFGITGTRGHRLWRHDAGYYYDYGLLFPGEIKAFKQQQQKLVGFGGMGYVLGWSRHIQFKAQLDFNTRFIRDTRAQEFGSEAVQLTLGGDVLFTNYRIEIGVAEDLIIDASPDVVFHVGISSRWPTDNY